jgi:NAD/NADP transhydrogenase alpha subunit
VLGFKVVAESGVGLRSLISDDRYREVGVEIVPTGKALYAQADVLLKLNPPIARADLGGQHELDMLKSGSTYLLLRIISE